MSHFGQRAWWVLCVLGIVALRPVSAAEFTPPPQGERDAVAAIAAKGGRAIIDGEYRVTSFNLAGDCGNDELKLLASCERLASLSISSRGVTDAGLDSLKGLSKLTSMTVINSGLTNGGIESLRAALPNCRITAAGFRGGPGGPGGPPAGFPSGTTRGTFGGPSRATAIARNSAVQDDLKLTPDQRQQITAASDFTQLIRAIDEKVAAVLTPEQRTRLKQIELQQDVPRNLLNDEIAAELKLTADQKTGIGKLSDESLEKLRAALAERSPQQDPVDITTKVREARDEKILATLNDDQRKAWLAMVGPAGPRISTGFSDIGGFGGFGDRGRVPADPAVAARNVFSRYDRDNDGKLTEAEFPQDLRTRRAMTDAGITVEFPAAREDFEKAYIKYLDQIRSRQ